MPELPEVETVVRQLNALLVGRRMTSASLIRERLAPETSPAIFARSLAGTRIDHVHRRGKHILFDLDNGLTLMAHLRMSGRFMLVPEDADEPRFTHAVFMLEGGAKLLFHDQRHFGFMKIVETPRLCRLPETPPPVGCV
jgi:formamidopyrimidine-DNA glycosylase